jgi:hypothetical protein
VLKALLQMVPGLEAQLLDASDEDIQHMAELVRVIRRSHLYNDPQLLFRYRRVLLVQGPTTQKALKALFSTGSHPAGSI